MAIGWPGGPLVDLGAEAFAKKINLLSKGRINIKVYAAGVLGNPLKVTDTVKNGVAECGHTWSGYDWGRDRTSVLFGGYAGLHNSEYFFHWIYRGGGVELWKEWRKSKFNLITFPLYGRSSEVFLHSHKPVRTLADLKGLKIRTTGAWMEIVKELGASPLTSSGGDVYPMLERKVIDATEWGSLYENVSSGFHRVAKYIIVPGVHQPVTVGELVINKGAWNKLTKYDQMLFEQAAELVTFESWLSIGQEDAKAYDFYKKEGNEIIVLDEEVQHEARKRAIDWAKKQAKKNAWFKRVFDSQQQFEELWKNAKYYRNTALD